MPVHVATTVPVHVPSLRPPTHPRAVPEHRPASASGQLAALDDFSIHAVLDEPEPPSPEDEGRDRRRYVRTLADMVDAGVPTGLDHKTLGRIAIRRVSAATGEPAEPRGIVAIEAPTGTGGTFPDAMRLIRRGSDRERVAELAMEAIDRFAPTCEAAMILVVRGEVAIGWKGFVRNDAPPPELAVPFEDKSLVVLARRNLTARCSAADLAPIDRLLLEAFGREDGDLVVVPVAIAGQVPCMIAIATASDAPVAAVEAVAQAAGAAFARLMRDASR